VPALEELRAPKRKAIIGFHVMDDRGKLSGLIDFIGPVFGTEHFSLFLYSLVRLHAPRIIVELGTGLGASAFSMALAAKRNRVGHVWTVDDLELFERDEAVVAKVLTHLQREWLTSTSIQNGKQYLMEVSRVLDVREYITFVHEKIELSDPRHFDSYPFSNERIDLLFADFKHGPDDILRILGHFLPRMSPASSIFIDSASTFWSSYLLLEQLVGQLNAGKVPKALQERSTADLRALNGDRRIVLVHLTEARKRSQNGAAWLKLEPIDLLPHPRTRMHS
jgi:Methyltransferase domain